MESFMFQIKNTNYYCTKRAMSKISNKGRLLCWRVSDGKNKQIINIGHEHEF